MLRALRQFAQASAEGRFVAKVRRIEMRTLRHIVDLLLEHRGRIGHPDPEQALYLGVVMLAGTLTELLLTDRDEKSWRTVIPKDKQVLKAELKRMFLNYLGVERSD